MPKVLQPDIVATSTGSFSGFIKAFVPLTREKLICISGSNGNMNYQRGTQVPLREKLIFGALTNSQLGYISNVCVNYTEEEEVISQDTYVFRNMDP
jgi:hypothetical protein